MNTIEALAIILQLKPKRLQSDIKALAGAWDDIMESTGSSSKQAVHVLHWLVSAYLRGLGYRMGNWQGYRAHQDKHAYIAIEVCLCVIEEGEIIFPTLYSLGFSSLETTTKIMKKNLIGQVDVLADAERILREKQ